MPALFQSLVVAAVVVVKGSGYQSACLLVRSRSLSNANAVENKKTEEASTETSSPRKGHKDLCCV